MPGPLDGVARKLAKSLTRTFGQKVVLRTSVSTYTPSTGVYDETNTDRAVFGLIQTVNRPDDDGVLRRMTTVRVPAKDLFVDGIFALPEVQDTVVVGADAIFGSDDNPGWTGGTEYRITAIEEQWANQQVWAYDLVLER